MKIKDRNNLTLLKLLQYYKLNLHSQIIDKINIHPLVIPKAIKKSTNKEIHLVLIAEYPPVRLLDISTHLV